jgi:cell division protein FtsZ
LTKGQGCGGKPEKGKNATLEDLDKIKDMLSDSDLVFITAGMGGGTGSGGAPVVAESLSKLNNRPLVVAVVTKPFDYEGKVRMKQAQEAIELLSQHCDSILVVPNQKLMDTMPKGCTIQEAFHEADKVLLKAVQGITDLITGQGLVNVDFQDLKTVMSKRGPAIMGVGQASGPDRARKAVEEAVMSPLLDDLSIAGAQGILINITGPGPNDLGLEEVKTISDFVTAAAHPEAEIFTGMAFDESLSEDGMIKVTVIATGLGPNEARPAKAAEPAEEAVDTAEPVQAEQAEEPKVLKYTPPAAPAVTVETERTPAHQQAAVGSAGRRERLKRYEAMGYGEGNLDHPAIDRIKRKPHDSLNLGEDNYAVPAYLRRSAD